MSSGHKPEAPPTPAPTPTPVAFVEQEGAAAKTRRKGITGRESTILANRLMLMQKNPFNLESILTNKL